MDSLYPQAWGRYLLLEHLASGGMADVYLAIQAKDLEYSRLVVIKRMRSAQKNSKDWNDMFRNEAQVLLRLQSPHIVQTYDVYFDEKEPYFVLEYIEGLCLKNIFDKLNSWGKNFPVEVSLEIVRQAALALSTAHNYRDTQSGSLKPILHRDVSPHNILISSEGYLKMIDFGIAKSDIISSLTASGMVKGKFSYMSPEQYLGEKQLDASSDLFCLGIILWELLSGKRLFESGSSPGELPMERFIRKSYVPLAPHEVAKATHVELSQLCMKLLNPDKEQRYKNALELENKIREFQIKLNLKSGTALLYDFMSANFGDQLRDERARLAKLVDQSKNTTLVTQLTKTSLEPTSRRNWLPITILIASLLLASTIFYLFKLQKSQPLPAERSTGIDDSQTQNNESRRTPYSFLEAEQQKVMRRYIKFTRDLFSKESEKVKNSFIQISNHTEKEEKNMRANYFKNLSPEIINQSLNETRNFLNEFLSTRNDEEKIKLMTKYKHTLVVMPAPRPNRQQEEQ